MSDTRLPTVLSHNHIFSLTHNYKLELYEFFIKYANQPYRLAARGGYRNRTHNTNTAVFKWPANWPEVEQKCCNSHTVRAAVTHRMTRSFFSTITDILVHFKDSVLWMCKDGINGRNWHTRCVFACRQCDYVVCGNTSGFVFFTESGAVFTLGKSYLSENHQSYFFIKNDAIRKLICGNFQSAVVCGEFAVTFTAN